MNLLPHQIEGVELLLSCRLRRYNNALDITRLVFDDPGLGKTLTATTALSLEPDRPVLVVCPAGLALMWRRELARRTKLRVRVLGQWDDRPARGDLSPGPGEALIVSYDRLTKLRLSLQRGTIAIYDEAHLAKSGTSHRGRAVGLCAAQVYAVGGWNWALTGTPMQNNPLDLWVLLKWMLVADLLFSPGAPRRGLIRFINHFGGTEDAFGRMFWPRRPPGGSLAGYLSGIALRRLRRDVLLEVPPKKYELTVVPVAGQAKSVLDRVLKRAADAVGVDAQATRTVGQITATTITSTALPDVAAGREQLAALKVPAMLERIEAHEEDGRLVAVYSCHRAPIDALARRKGWRVITGDEPEAARDEAVRLFQAGELRGIGYTGAGSLGHTLTAADVVLVVSPPWTDAEMQQAEDRAVRIGTLKQVVIEHLIAQHPFDTWVYDVLGVKRERSGASVDEPCGPEEDPISLSTMVVRPLSWLSHSRDEMFRDCHFKYSAKYDLGVEPVESMAERRIGALFAACMQGRLEVWSAGGGTLSKEADDAAAKYLRKLCARETWPEKFQSTEEAARVAWQLAQRCCWRAGFDSGRWRPYVLPNGKPAVEPRLEIPVPEWLRDRYAGLVCKPDLIAHDMSSDGRLTVVDFKVRGKKMAESIRDGNDDPQLMLYMYACRQLGINVELALRLEVLGKLPDPPQFISKGKALSTAKANIVDVDEYVKAIEEHGFDLEDYADYIHYLRTEGPKIYQWVQCGRVQSALDRIFREVCVRAHYASIMAGEPLRNLRNFPGSPCQRIGGCEYKELCTATLPAAMDPRSYADTLVALGKLKRRHDAGEPVVDEIIIEPEIDVP